MSDADETTPPEPSRPRRSPAFLATVIALPVAVVACFITFAVLAHQKQDQSRAADEAGHLRSIAATASADPACEKLLGHLPADMGGFRRDGTSEPAGFARWIDKSIGSVEVRCGTERPGQLTATAKLQMVNGVQWIQAVPGGAPAPDGGSYWTAVDHRPYVTIWVPDGAGTSAMQATSDAIRTQLQPASLDLGK